MLRSCLFFAVHMFFHLTLHGQGITTDTIAIVRLVEASEKAEKAQQFSESIRSSRQALALPCAQSIPCFYLRASAALSAGRSYLNLRQLDSAIFFCNMAFHLRCTMAGDTNSEPARRTVNSLGNAYYEKAMLDSAMHCYQRALVWSKKLYKPASKEVASALQNIGVVYRDRGDYASSLSYQQQALTIRRGLGAPDTSLLIQSYYNLGLLYRAMSQPDSAINYLQIGRRYAIQKADVTRELNCVMSIAYCLSMKNHHQEALALYEQALNRRIALWKNNPEDPRLAQYYADFGTLLTLAGHLDRGNVYLERGIGMMRTQAAGNFLPVVLQQAAANLMRINPYNDLAQKWLLESVKILEQRGARFNTLADDYENLGAFAYANQRYENAIQWHQKALSLRETFGDSFSIATARNLRLLAESQVMSGDSHTSLSNLHRAVTILEQLGDLQQPEYVLALANWAHAYTDLRQWDLAQAKLDLALGQLNFNLSQPDFSHIPDLDAVNVFLDRQVELLLEKVENGDHGALPTAKRAVQSSLQFLAFKQRSITGIESRLQHRRSAHEVFGQAMRIALLEGQLSEAFHYSELDKAQALRSDYLAQAVNLSTGALGLLLDTIHYVQAKVALLNQRRQQETGTVDKQEIEARLFEARNQLENQWLDLREHYPAYWQENFGGPNLDLTALREAVVPAHTALIEFYYASETLVTFLLTSDTLLVWSTKADQLPALIDKYLRQVVNDKSMIVPAIDSCRTLGHELYQLLLVQPLTAVRPAVKHLIIIPDGILARLPFAALPTKLTSSSAPAQWPFLLKKYAVSYAFSGTLLEAQVQHSPSTAPKPFGGFAPEYTEAELRERLKPVRRDGVEEYDLQYAREEVQRLAALSKGDAWLAQEATETRFRQLSARYRVVHLAMHAIVDNLYPDFSKLLFTGTQRGTLPEADGDFYAGDLPGLQLEADLVTLSACHTASGRIVPGESTLSLAYAFTQAGTPAVAASLWPADDKRTMQLMVVFYEQMKAGLPKDEALRQAQLALIGQSEKVLEFAHPFFWASFGIIGSTRPISFGK